LLSVGLERYVEDAFHVARGDSRSDIALVGSDRPRYREAVGRPGSLVGRLRLPVPGGEVDSGTADVQPGVLQGPLERPRALLQLVQRVRPVRGNRDVQPPVPHLQRYIDLAEFLWIQVDAKDRLAGLGRANDVYGDLVYRLCGLARRHPTGVPAQVAVAADAGHEAVLGAVASR